MEGARRKSARPEVGYRQTRRVDLNLHWKVNLPSIIRVAEACVDTYT